MSNASPPAPGAAPVAPEPIRFVELWLPVEGMSCASCVNRIERFLGKTDGVAEASVNLATEVATVRYDPAAVGPDEMVGAIEAAGYEVRAAALAAAQAGSAGAGSSSPTRRTRPSAPAPARRTSSGCRRRSRSQSPSGSWSSCSGRSCRGRWRS